jgi:excisionase family DNA binding protein
MSTLSQSEWLTTDEAAHYLKVKPRSLLLWTRQGKIKAYVLSGTKRRIWRYRREDLDSTLIAKPVLSSGPSSSVRSEERRVK